MTVTLREKLLQPRIGTLSMTASAHLDMFRGTAAFLVLIAHWRMLLFLDGSELHLSAGLYFLYWITKLGHQAVVVFFVLSGFLVGRTVLRPVWSGKWSTARYLVHRLTRLEIVLIPALILCWALDKVGSGLFHPSPIYLGTAGLSAIPYNILDHLHLHIFFGNIAFLQTIYVPTFGSDDPLWSLTNEFWYYVLFPCFVAFLSSGFRRNQRAIAGITGICLVTFFWFHDGDGILRGFLCWLMGAALGVLPPPRLNPRAIRSGMIVAGFGMVVQMVLTYAPAPFDFERNFVISDFVLGIVFSALMYFSLHDRSTIGEPYRRSAKFAAGISYTLYLTHMPLLVLIAAWRGTRWYPDAEHLAIGSGILFLPVFYAIGVWAIFERRTDTIRKTIEHALGL